jgi:hypothetical protein
MGNMMMMMSMEIVKHDGETGALLYAAGGVLLLVLSLVTRSDSCWSTWTMRQMWSTTASAG